jgi:hypothetical protein
MNHLEKIIETLKKNQEVARAFFEIEASVLSVLNFRDFLERLLADNGVLHKISNCERKMPCPTSISR